MDYQKYLAMALEIEQKITPIFKEGFFSINHIEWKKEKDPVTEYDKKIEALTRKHILSFYPDHLVLGEEDGLGENLSSDFKWIVDPIDGTMNYIRGFPFVSFSLALLYKGEFVVSVVSNPILGEVFSAVVGQGAFLNGERIHVSSCQDMRKSYLTLGRYSEKYASQYHNLLKEFQTVRNPGSAALAMAYVAAGRIEGAIYYFLSPWDMAGGFLLIKEAGGLVTNITKDDFSLEEGSLLASNQFSYATIKKILNS